MIDSHCHLDYCEPPVAELVGRARAAGVDRMATVATNGEAIRHAIAAAEDHDEVVAIVGRHPHETAGFDDLALEEIERAAAHPRARAIGETGLDYDRVFSPIPDQLDNLRRNLRLAAETGKPIILHCRSRAGQRDAQDALLAELTAMGAAHPRIVVHSFSGPTDYASAMLDLGAVISFSGLVFRTGEEASADVARSTPGDRIVVETDSPFLAAPGAPKGRNEPRYVGITATWVAERRGADGEAFGDALVATYDRTFRAVGSPS